MKTKINNMLGLAQRSGNLVSGEDTCLMSIKKGKIKLVIVPNDASDNTKKKFKDACDYRKIDYINYGNRDELSQSIGKFNRTVYGVIDEGFAKKIRLLVEGS